jgi:hypothetical protein
VNSDVGWHFSAETGDWVGRVRMMEEVEDGRGSYIDIVRSMVPQATVPVTDVERERMDLSNGPCCPVSLLSLVV